MPEVLAGGSPQPLRVRDLRPVDHSDLNRRIPELSFQAIDLPSAIQAIRMKAQANIVVDWQSFDAAGIPRNQQITLSLWDVTVEQALRAVCIAAGDKGAISVTSDEGLILVGDGQQSEFGELRIYDVRDLVELFLPFEKSIQPPPQPDVVQQTSPAEDLIDAIEKVIVTQIKTDTWHDNGGPGAIVEVGGRLVISQLPRNHRKVAELLDLLRTGGSKEGLSFREFLKKRAGGS